MIEKKFVVKFTDNDKFVVDVVDTLVCKNKYTFSSRYTLNSE
jgi:hypothetical protein